MGRCRTDFVDVNPINPFSKSGDSAPEYVNSSQTRNTNTMNIINLLGEITQANPDQVALIHGQVRITYRALDEQTRAVGAFFQAQGVKPGQRALLLIPLGIDFYVTLLGLARIGVTVMLIDPAVGRQQINRCCHLVQPDLFVGSPKAHLLRFTTGAIRQIRRKFSLYRSLPGSQLVRTNMLTIAGVDAATNQDDLALITFTSGSTGSPKAIGRSHGFLLAQHKILCKNIPAHGGEIELNTLPVFILSSLARGVTVVIPQQIGKRMDKINGAQIVDEVTTHGVNRLLAAPAFCQRLADQLATTKQTLPGIQQLYTGGGPVFPSLLTKLAHTLPNANLVAVYGSTEAEPIAQITMQTFTAADWQAMQRGEGLLAGKPIAEIQLAIIPDMVGTALGNFTQADFAAYCLPAQDSGEIVVSGAHVQQHYLGGNDGLSKFNVAGAVWHRTGDAGYCDEQGQLWLLGRCSAQVTAGGATCYPFGIEAAAMSQAGVERAAFIEVDGEGVLVVQTARAAWSQVRLVLQQALPTGTRLQRVDAIPVDTRHGSKVLYGELRQLLRG